MAEDKSYQALLTKADRGPREIERHLAGVDLTVLAGGYRPDAETLEDALD